ncbi:GxxExxY protein [Candidatus Pacebacteria bacterium]|nr:GxxExxY protein [Candidatus Paceibacterota bacterium]
MKPSDNLADHFRIDTLHQKALMRLSIETVEQLLYHLPARYEDISDVQSVEGLSKDQEAIVYGQIGGLKARRAWKSKRPIAEGWIEDGSARIKVMWFNQPYLAKMLTDGMYVKLAGKVTGTEGKLYIANPEVEKLDSLPVDRHDSIFKGSEAHVDETIYPVYRESKGVTSKWFYHTALKCFEKGILNNFRDPIPKEILDRYNLPPLHTALVWIHSPKKAEHAESARKRFAFEEVFYIQIQNALNRAEANAASTYSFKTTKAHIKEFTDRFPFKLTKSQDKSIAEILKDFGGNHAMSRLLEGDVGSGKTAVAATTAYAVATSRPPEGTKPKLADIRCRPVTDVEFGALQVAYMAPTEILAKQHFESFIEYFHHLPIQIGLITGSGCMKFPSKVDPTKPTKISRAQLLKWVKSGEIPILIGTHALIYKSVEFKHLAHIIIDEQHRFGVNQRKALMRRTSQNGRGMTQNGDETISDAHTDSKLLYENLTYKIRGAAFAVKKTLGTGHKESVYQSALAVELLKQGLSFQQEKRLPVMYDGKRVGYYQPDLIIEDKIIIELKALPRISQQNQRQTWDYLRGTQYRLALLINFGSQEPTVKRIVYDEARKLPRTSASVPQQSAQQVLLPHLLSMTATPIPRTLALTIYGDLDITLLDEMPKGRKPVITELIGPGQKKKMYEHVRSELTMRRQAYVICPRIEEPDPDKQTALNVKSVKAEAERLKKDVFQEYEIGVLHGKMKPVEKDAMMSQFSNHEVDILVATSVVEVGVNVPNATNIIIEGAERFGLSQLHQLRGRVIRGTHQSYCFAVTDSKSEKTRERLKALKTAKNGFELAEYDLSFRGSGELYGAKQSGLSDLGMEAIKNLRLVEAARTEAQKLVAKNPDLSKNFPLIAHKVAHLGEVLHME